MTVELFVSLATLDRMTTLAEYDFEDPLLREGWMDCAPAPRPAWTCP